LGFESGGKTYDPTLPQFNTLHAMDHLHGYWVKLTNSDILTLEGAEVGTQSPIYMESGWNLISYLPESTDSVGNALGSVYDNVEIVMGYDNGGLTHVPGLDLFNTLQLLEYGKGYWVKLTAKDTLVYPISTVHTSINTNDNTTSGIILNKNDGAFQIISTNRWINIFSDGIDEDLLPIGTQVYAKDNDGVICGHSEVERSGQFGIIPVYADDITTDIDEGALPGEEIFLYLGDASTPIALTWIEFGDLINVAKTLGVNDALQMPKEFMLYQNYPNPFNPKTIIKYELPIDTRVTIKVFDVTGREIVTLIDKNQKTGYHSIQWSGRDNKGNKATNGIYFYSIKADSFYQKKKMLLLK